MTSWDLNMVFEIWHIKAKANSSTSKHSKFQCSGSSSTISKFDRSRTYFSGLFRIHMGSADMVVYTRINFRWTSLLSRNNWELWTLRHGIQNSMEAILACHPAPSTKWLDWVVKMVWTMTYAHIPHLKSGIFTSFLHTTSSDFGGHFWREVPP